MLPAVAIAPVSAAVALWPVVMACAMLPRLGTALFSLARQRRAMPPTCAHAIQLAALAIAVFVYVTASRELALADVAISAVTLLVVA